MPGQVLSRLKYNSKYSGLFDYGGQYGENDHSGEYLSAYCESLNTYFPGDWKLAKKDNLPVSDLKRVYHDLSSRASAYPTSENTEFTGYDIKNWFFYLDDTIVVPSPDDEFRKNKKRYVYASDGSFTLFPTLYPRADHDYFYRTGVICEL